MKIVLSIAFAAASLTWPAAAAADEVPAFKHSQVSYAQPIKAQPNAYRPKTYVHPSKVTPKAENTKNKSLNLNKKSTCTGPAQGSVTYPGSKKRYDLMGRRIK